MSRVQGEKTGIQKGKLNMKKNKKTGAVLVCPDALVREQLRTWALGQQEGRGGHAGPLCLRTRQIFSLLEQTPGTKKET